MRKTAFTRELTTSVFDEMLDRLKRGFRQKKRAVLLNLSGMRLR